MAYWAVFGFLGFVNKNLSKLYLEGNKVKDANSGALWYFYSVMPMFFGGLV